VEQIVHKTPITKITKANCTGGVAQVVESLFASMKPCVQMPVKGREGKGREGKGRGEGKERRKEKHAVSLWSMYSIAFILNLLPNPAIIPTEIPNISYSFIFQTQETA
jgi:hypothetical protein